MSGKRVRSLVIKPNEGGASQQDGNGTPKRKKSASKADSKSRSKMDAVATSKQTEEKSSKRVNRRLVKDVETTDSDTSKNNNANLVEKQGTRQSGRIKQKQFMANPPGEYFDGELRKFLNPFTDNDGTESSFFENFSKQLEIAEKMKRSNKNNNQIKLGDLNKVAKNLAASQFLNISGDEERAEESFVMEVETGGEDGSGSSDGASDSENEPDKGTNEDPDPVQQSEAPKEGNEMNKERQLAEFERLKKLPDVQEFLKLMAGEPSTSGGAPKKKGKKKQAPKGQQDAGKILSTPKNRPFVPVVKSPSVDTIYVPAIKYIGSVQGNEPRPEITNYSQQGVANHIQEQVQQIRLNDFPGDESVESRQKERVGQDQHQGVRSGGNRDPEHRSVEEQQFRAQQIADDVILEAERQRAAIAAPSGMIPENLHIKPADPGLTVPPVDNTFNDDEYCNATQGTKHVELALANKIKVGGFLDLDKIAPRLRDMKPPGETKWQMRINKEGHAYYVPYDDRDNGSNKIASFGRWEQAFRVYAAIYTAANPHRGSEIYQYIHSINCAAMSFQWDNVAAYDYQFRKDMEAYPQRSWAKTNTQLWSLCMRDSLPTRGQGGSNTGGRKTGELRDICCWRHNRNQCKKSAKDCKFEHRCSSCGSFNHIYLNCPKRRKATGGEGDKQDKPRDATVKVAPAGTSKDTK